MRNCLAQLLVVDVNISATEFVWNKVFLSTYKLSVFKWTGETEFKITVVSWRTCKQEEIQWRPTTEFGREEVWNNTWKARHGCHAVKEIRELVCTMRWQKQRWCYLHLWLVSWHSCYPCLSILPFFVGFAIPIQHGCQQDKLFCPRTSTISVWSMV